MVKKQDNEKNGEKAGTAVTTYDEKDTRKLLFEQLKEQYIMPWKEQASLIRSETPMTERGVQLALKVAKSFGLPLQGLNIITNKRGEANVYVNADGIRWRLHTDSRGIRSSTADVVHRPTTTEPWVEVRATTVMGDGSEYTNFGAVDCTPGSGVSNAILKAVTKGKRRSGVDAVGVALPIAEDFLEWVDEERKAGKKVDIIDAEYKEMQSTPVTEPKNLAELFVWIEQHGHALDEAEVVAGMSTSDMAADVKAALAKLKAAWETKNV